MYLHEDAPFFEDLVLQTAESLHRDERYYLAGEIPSRQSRHIYDLFKLQPQIAFDGDLAALVAMVRSQRKGNFRCPSADDGVSLADTIDAIRKKEPYRKDYERVTAPLLYEDVSYDVASQVLAGIASFLREYGV